MGKPRNDHDALFPQVCAHFARHFLGRPAWRDRCLPGTRNYRSDQQGSSDGTRRLSRDGADRPFVIVPLAFASLLTGLIQSLGTTWGLFRHYWVLVKLLLTVFATLVLLVKMELIGSAARLAAEEVLSRADLRAAGIQLVVHAGGGLLVLLVPMVLSVYKPRGMTQYGRRKQSEQLPV